MKRLIIAFVVGLVLMASVVVPAFADPAATFSIDGDTLSGTLATPNGTLTAEVSLDLSTGEATESHCLTTPGHTSGDQCD